MIFSGKEIESVRMKFWKLANISIAILAIIMPLLILVENRMNSVYSTCAITLFTAFITILSTLYTNYKSDLRIIMNKRQEIYPELLSKLKNIHGNLFEKDFNKGTVLDYKNPLRIEDYKKLYEEIISFKKSFDFVYCSENVKKIINEFIEEYDKIKISKEDKLKEREDFVLISQIVEEGPCYLLLKKLNSFNTIMEKEIDKILYK